MNERKASSVEVTRGGTGESIAKALILLVIVAATIWALYESRTAFFWTEAESAIQHKVEKMDVPPPSLAPNPSQ